MKKNAHVFLLTFIVASLLAVACNTLARWGGAGAGAVVGGAVGGLPGAAVGAIAGDAGGDALVADPPSTVTTINAQPGSTVYASRAEAPRYAWWEYVIMWVLLIVLVWILKVLPQSVFDHAHTLVSLGTNKLAVAVRRRFPVLVPKGSTTGEHGG